FLLFVNYMDAHTPYAPPANYAARFPPRDASPRERLISAYDASIAFADAELRRLVRGLQTRNLLDRTIVIITSDHGEAFSEHGTTGHGMSVFDEQIHVPLVIRTPRQTTPAYVAEPVSLVDVFSFLTASRAVTASQAISEGFPLVPSMHAPKYTGRALCSGDWK